MPEREGVLEVDDAEQQTDELAQRDHQRDCERGALGREVVDGADAQVPGVRVKEVTREIEEVTVRKTFCK